MYLLIYGFVAALIGLIVVATFYGPRYSGWAVCFSGTALFAWLLQGQAPKAWFARFPRASASIQRPYAFVPRVMFLIEVAMMSTVQLVMLRALHPFSGIPILAALSFIATVLIALPPPRPQIKEDMTLNHFTRQITALITAVPICLAIMFFSGKL